MSSLRTIGAFTAALVAATLLSTGTAVAQTAAPEAVPLKQTVTLTGTKGLRGTFTIDRFARRGGQAVAIGTVRGRLRGRRVTRRDVVVPATASRPTTAGASQVPPTPGACQILNLVLGPIDLNLLGLRVRTNQINLRIEGVPGPGNLLGNLLCGITGILDPAAASRGDLVAGLNATLALVPAR